MLCSNCGQELGDVRIRRLIREELKQLDQETIEKLADQIAAKLARDHYRRPATIQYKERGKK